MAASLRTVAALILSVTILQLAGGLMGVALPLAMAADGLSETRIGLAGAAYSAGFMAGAWYAPRLLNRVGHVRVFAAFAGIAAAGTLALHWADGPIAWSILRAIAGAAIAIMFASIESWLSGALSRQERGSVIGVYMVSTKFSLALGPFLLAFSPSPLDQAAEPFLIAGAVIALALAPVCLTTMAQPEAPKAEPIALRAQFETAPAAVTACFGAGLINSGVLTLSPLYAEAAYGPERVAAFQAAAWIGSLLLQYPAGKLSDRIDRRTVIAALCALATLAALALAALGPGLAFPVAAALFALWGAGALSFYGLAVAHMADRSTPAELARTTSGLLFVWAAGAIIGPALIGGLAELSGRGAVFWVAALGAASLTGLMVWRRSARAPTAAADKEPFANASATSVVAAELAYAGDRREESGDAPAAEAVAR